MKIIHLTYPLQLPIDQFSGEQHVMAIGDFDGLHRGHREVILGAKQMADDLELRSSIMTFHPHPREVLGNTKYARYLTPFNDKMARFAELGIDYCFVVSFDLNFSRVLPQHFVDQMLLLLNVHTVVVGFDFTFGQGGSGTVETLRQLSDGRIAVNVVKPYHMHGDTVSSTLIREQLHLGRIDRVIEYLGRHYAIRGQVVSGHGRGRKIGFPTANLQVTVPYVIPRHGVYVVKVTIGSEQYEGVMNIGVKPTFSDDETNPTLEVHLLDFSGDLYGQQLKVEFVSFLRDEQKFDSVDSLIAQIGEDVEKARFIFTRET